MLHHHAVTIVYGIMRVKRIIQRKGSTSVCLQPLALLPFSYLSEAPHHPPTVPTPTLPFTLAKLTLEVKTTCFLYYQSVLVLAVQNLFTFTDYDS